MSAAAWRVTDDDVRAIDVNRLRREGFIADKPWRGSYVFRPSGAWITVEGGRDSVELAFQVTNRWTGESEWVEQRVALQWSPCHYGGERPWFQCPDCGRRVGKLYGGARFTCRHCLGLVYASTLETPPFRLLRRAQNLRVRAGGGWDVTKPFPPRPKGMHWRTYWRLRSEAEEAAYRSLCAAVAQFR